MFAERIYATFFKTRALFEGSIGLLLAFGIVVSFFWLNLEFFKCNVSGFVLLLKDWNF
jgi:hypothetical protein